MFTSAVLRLFLDYSLFLRREKTGRDARRNDPTVLSDRSILYYGTFDSVSRLARETLHGPPFTGHKTLLTYEKVWPGG